MTDLERLKLALVDEYCKHGEGWEDACTRRVLKELAAIFEGYNLPFLRISQSAVEQILEGLPLDARGEPTRRGTAGGR